LNASSGTSDINLISVQELKGHQRFWEWNKTDNHISRGDRSSLQLSRLENLMPRFHVNTNQPGIDSTAIY
ncbi:MAG: hypothetical protein ACRENT_04760, partial [Thermodesulfobacteriota bacterium]